MNKLPFHGPKLKLARAKQHIAELAAQIEVYIRRDPFVVFVERRSDGSGKPYLSMRGREQIPETFSAIFGDAVHNLRTALDIMANDVIALGGVTPKKVYFPFADSEAGLEEQISKKMKGATPDVVDIVRKLKPYKGGDEILRALHDLDISDKHICLLGVGAGIAVYPKFRQVPSERGPKSITLEADFSAMRTVQIDMTGFNIPDDVIVLGKAAQSDPIQIVIAKNLPLSDQPAVGALNAMVSKAESVVQTFEAHCLRGTQADPS